MLKYRLIPRVNQVSAGIWLLLFMCLFAQPLIGQPNHPYPRISVFHFGYAPADWYARFQMVRGAKAVYDQVKQINPDAQVFRSRDWNVWENDQPAPDEWFARDADGNKIDLGSYGGYLMDISDLCLRSNGQRYCDYLVPFTNNLMADNPQFDGFLCQGVWWYPGMNDNIDLDRNGVNDWDEHGKSWLTDRWLAGVHVASQGVYNGLSAMNRMLLLNSGTFHAFEWSNSNGLMIEKQTASVNQWLIDRYYNWMRAAPDPHCFLIDCRASSKTNYTKMRFLLTFVLLGDAYFSFTDHMHEHNYHRYYDEYDTDLGFSTSNMIEIANKIHIRFFENGISIINATGSTKTISDADLQSYPQYNGPYYRFHGGQDPAWNNGEIFNSITLQSSQLTYGNDGEGIILLTEPKNVVSDIIVDNSEIATSAGSEPAQLVGTWMFRANKNHDPYTLNSNSAKGWYDYAATTNGNGDTYATYRPTIGLAGNYEVYEWHGWLGSASGDAVEATNVPYTITYAGGVNAIGTIDQSKNPGQWNSLGIYYFNTGTNSSARITNAANKSVIADAFKFVFRGTEKDSIPPEAPSFLQGNASENNIQLNWTPPPQASDGDTASSYQVFRDFSLVASPRTEMYSDNNLQESTQYYYHVYAMDNLGNRSLVAAEGGFTTLADVTPPILLSVTGKSLHTIELAFNELLEQSTAVNVNNYTIDGGITVTQAVLKPDLKSVELTTSMHVIGNNYNITVSGILDRAANPNMMGSGVSIQYQGVSSSITISISADDSYELYVNGVFLGSNADWTNAQVYTVPSVAGKNVVAVKTTDVAGTAGLVAEIDFEGTHYVTDETWKIATTDQTGWETETFSDIMWNKATSHGLHGTAMPWAQYRNVNGISDAGDVHWIWSADNEGDDVVYMRFSLGVQGDTTPPNPPTGVAVTKHNDHP